MPNSLLLNKSNDNQLLFSFLSDGARDKRLTELEFHYGAFIYSESDSYEHPVQNLLVLVGISLCRQLNRQSTCIAISDVLSSLDITDVELPLPPIGTWLDIISRSSFTGPEAVFSVFGNLIYFTRYFVQETLVADFVKRTQRKQPAHYWLPTDIVNGKSAVVDALFDNLAGEEFDWQKHAVLNSLSHRFSIITGGPGTGKTTTVLKLLSAILVIHEQLEGYAKAQKPTLSIALTAPTGKAALRLTESITKGLDKLTVDASIKAKIPTHASTIHRLLKPRGPNSYLYNAKNKLLLDVLILDEASMVDLSLMTDLLNAIPDNCQVVLLGDQHQLSSVEAGNLLAELCAPLAPLSLNERQRVMPITQLEKSHRFRDDSVIGQFAKAVNSGNVVESQRILRENSTEHLDSNSNSNSANEVSWLLPTDSSLNRVIKLIVERQREVVALVDSMGQDNEVLVVKRAFAIVSELQVLTSIRETEFGVSGINAKVESSLVRSNLKDREASHYVGRPIMVEENAYHLQLFNGDIGIQLPDPTTGQLITYFMAADDKLIKVFNQRLPKHSSVYAMTIHKSQGSEFLHTIMLMPNQWPLNAVLCKELLYTGITRAIKRFTIIGELREITETAQQVSKRQSGIAQMLLDK